MKQDCHHGIDADDGHRVRETARRAIQIRRRLRIHRRRRECDKLFASVPGGHAEKGCANGEENDVNHLAHTDEMRPGPQDERPGEDGQCAGLEQLRDFRSGVRRQ
jgi:hypothetical protein